MSVLMVIADVGVATVVDCFVVLRDIVTLKIMTVGFAAIGMKLLADIL